MVSILIGIVLVIVGVFAWLGNLSTAHALGILIGSIGVFILLWGLVPPSYIRR